MKRFNTWLNRMLERLFPEAAHYKPSPVSTETMEERMLAVEYRQRDLRKYIMILFRRGDSYDARIASLESRLAAVEERSKLRNSVGTVAERN